MQIRHTLLVDQPAEHLWEVVADVERYPGFVPGCELVTVTDRSDERYVTDMRIAVKRIAFELRTVTLTRRPEAIAVRLERGPFRNLEIDWSFAPLTSDACRIGFVLTCEFGPLLENSLSGALLARASRRVVDAFIARAERLGAS